MPYSVILSIIELLLEALSYAGNEVTSDPIIKSLNSALSEAHNYLSGKQ